MTQEPEYTAPAPFPEAGHVMFGIPGIPYSQVRIPLVYNIAEMNVLIAAAMETAKLLKEAYEDTFHAKELEDERAAFTGAASPPPPGQRLPQQPQRATLGTRRATDLDPNLVIRGNCPEHGCPAQPSKAEYNEIEFDEDGNERYAKYFCGGKDNGTGKNHGLFARQLVPVGPF